MWEGEGEEERARRRRRRRVACRWVWLIFRLLRRQKRVDDGVHDRRHPTTAAKEVPKPQHLCDLAPSEMTCIRRAWS